MGKLIGSHRRVILIESMYTAMSHCSLILVLISRADEQEGETASIAPTKTSIPERSRQCSASYGNALMLSLVKCKVNTRASVCRRCQNQDDAYCASTT
jgi:hypothetical protein